MKQHTLATGLSCAMGFLLEGKPEEAATTIQLLNQVNWFQELMRFAPTVLFLGMLWFIGRKMKSGLGGSGGRGGIFSMGKATVTKMDKNAKNKVRNGGTF